MKDARSTCKLQLTINSRFFAKLRTALAPIEKCARDSVKETGINKCERPRQKTASTNLSQTSAVTGPVNPTWGINRRGATNHMFITEPFAKCSHLFIPSGVSNSKYRLPGDREPQQGFDASSSRPGRNSKSHTAAKKSHAFSFLGRDLHEGSYGSRGVRKTHLE